MPSLFSDDTFCSLGPLAQLKMEQTRKQLPDSYLAECKCMALKYFSQVRIKVDRDFPLALCVVRINSNFSWNKKNIFFFYTHTVMELYIQEEACNFIHIYTYGGGERFFLNSSMCDDLNMRLF